MKRIDEVYEKLKELYNDEGISATEIADALGLDRANVSKDLNKLCDEGKVLKTKGKPVLFSITENNEDKVPETVLDKFSDNNPSLLSAVKQAKAAVLYPPHGMHMLILGDTGVGKSMFAGLIHKYAIEMERMVEGSPFITFNCADYACNPQLLISQIFGTKKGAYTGAETDKVGLIEKADGGILFLDEVHRLPPEGQEMFFTFMDKGTFRRLGETDVERKASVLIISATTENPDSVLLKTFTRRIPMIIHIPELKERGMDERFNLICHFMREESFRLGREIKVSVNSMRALLSYNCINNVGQLKTDVQLACAKAYADFVSHNKESIEINSMELPIYIKQGLYMETEHRMLWNKLIDINKRYCIFSEDRENMLYDETDKDESIYEMIDLRIHELRGRGINSDELEREMGKDIEDYFKNYIHNVNKRIDISNLESFIPAEVIGTVDEIVRYSEESLKRKLSQSVYYGIAVHISNSIDRIRRNKKIINPQLNKIRTEHNNEFNIALDCIKIIERTLDISMPIDEAGFLTLFFVYDERNIEKSQKNVKIVVVAHGSSTASSMVDTANRLLGVNYAIGIDAPIDEKPQQVIMRIKTYLNDAKVESDILFLVDMGSLTTFAGEIEQELHIKTMSLPLVSTLHVIEATRKAMMGFSLEEVYKETLKVNSLLEYELTDDNKDEDERKKLAIITICTTGEGSAVTLKNILCKELKFDGSLFDIIPLNLIGNESIYSKLKNLQNDYKIVCIVSSFKIETKIPQFNLQEILNKQALGKIQTLVNVETTYIKMGETLENQLKHVNGEEVLHDIHKFNNRVEEELNIKIETNFLIGVTFHLACMIDRLKEGQTIDEFDGRVEFIKENQQLYGIIKKACTVLNDKYSIIITEDEICYIMNFFNYKNYV